MIKAKVIIKDFFFKLGTRDMIQIKRDAYLLLLLKSA